MSQLRREFGAQLAVSFEWPGCCDGWDLKKNALARQLKKHLPRVVDFDGCAFNLETQNGIHIDK
eukprot:1439326-Pyramimonas_sp.AAC.1